MAASWTNLVDRFASDSCLGVTNGCLLQHLVRKSMVVDALSHLLPIVLAREPVLRWRFGSRGQGLRIWLQLTLVPFPSTGKNGSSSETRLAAASRSAGSLMATESRIEGTRRSPGEPIATESHAGRVADSHWCRPSGVRRRDLDT